VVVLMPRFVDDQVWGIQDEDSFGARIEVVGIRDIPARDTRGVPVECAVVRVVQNHKVRDIPHCTLKRKLYWGHNCCGNSMVGRDHTLGWRILGKVELEELNWRNQVVEAMGGV
jgi:hypothetical protein